MTRRTLTTRRRNGAVLVAAMVCLLVITAIIGTMIRGALRDQRRLRIERDLRQAELLLEAGIGRAASRLAADPDYRSETWILPAGTITESGEGRVTIAISPIADQTSLSATVMAEYPAGSESSVRRSRIVQLSTQTPRP